jgi:DNA-binding LacI/PurR family transcriptional regulator
VQEKSKHKKGKLIVPSDRTGYWAKLKMPAGAKRPRNLTINDVADLAGVSYQTVSRVINDMPEVAPLTREKVRQVLQRVGFRPNMTARQLASRRSTTVGLVTFATGYYGPSQILVNSEQAAKEAGLSFMFTGIVDQSTRQIRRAVDELCAHQVCGILIHLPLAINLRDLQDVCRNVPVVAVDSDLGFRCPSVFIDQHLGSQLATRHLIELGHRKIAYIRGPVFWRVARVRYAGWRKALKAAGLRGGPVIEGNWTAESGFEAAEKLIKGDMGKCTAIVAANDQMALGAILALESHDIRVPEDISIVGFDDLPEAAFFRPPLSTVRQDFPSLGRLSVQLLLERVNPKRTQSSGRTIEPAFVQRKSAIAISGERVMRPGE